MNKYEVVTYDNGEYHSTFFPNMYNAVKFAYEHRDIFLRMNLNGERIYDTITVKDGRVYFSIPWGERLFGKVDEE